MTLRDEVALLRRLGLFSAVDPVRLEVLAFAAARRRFEAGATLFEAGAPANGAFLVTAGSAVMLAHGPDGAPQVTRLDRGDLIGETALLREGRWRSTVRAASDLETLWLERVQFQRLLAEFPEMAEGLAKAAAARLDALGQDLARLATALGARGGDSK